MVRTRRSSAASFDNNTSFTGEGVSLISPSHHYDPRFKDHWNAKYTNPTSGDAGCFGSDASVLDALSPLRLSPVCPPSGNRHDGCSGLDVSALGRPSISASIREEGPKRVASSFTPVKKIVALGAILLLLSLFTSSSSRSSSPVVAPSAQKVDSNGLPTTTAPIGMEEVETLLNNVNNETTVHLTSITVSNSVEEEVVAPQSDAPAQTDAPATPLPKTEEFISSKEIEQSIRQQILEAEKRLQDQLRRQLSTLETQSSSSSSSSPSAESSEALRFLLNEVADLRASSLAVQDTIGRVEQLGETLASKVKELQSVRSESSSTKQKLQKVESALSTFAVEIEQIRAEAKLFDANEHREALENIFATSLARVHADGIGMKDFAAEQSGGSVLSHSPTISACTNANSLSQWMRCNWDLFLVTPPQMLPQTAIRADTSLGQCWAMRGSSGYISIALSTPLIVTNFSIEHIPTQVAIDASSAPHHVRLWATPVNGYEEELIGEAEYLIDKPATATNNLPHIQTFPTIVNQEFGSVRFEILSNHGNEKFTCLYRVRVHGTQP